MREAIPRTSGTQMRPLAPGIALGVKLIAVAFSALSIYTCGFGLITVELHRGGYLLFTLVLCFLLYPARRDTTDLRRPTLVDGLLVILSVTAVGYWIIEYPAYVYRMGNPDSIDIFMGSILLLLALEVARRVVGYVLPMLAILFLAYAYWGPHVPGILAHYGFKAGRIVEYVAVGMGGIYGVVTDTYATFIFPFVIFAAFLQAAGGGGAIEEISRAMAGTTRGGPAKIAVVSSGFIGSITGSSAANAVITGSYTIPMMIRSGYRPHVAAAVEAAASTGGQFMPPIMGAAAFLIAAFTETPYLEIIKIAAIPAMLYFLGVGMMVHFIAAREGLIGLSRDQVPSLKAAILRGGHLLLPIGVILGILIAGYSVQLAAAIGIGTTIGLSYLRRETRMTPRRILEALAAGARGSLAVGATAGVIGIIMGIVSMSGLGIKFSSVVISFSGGILPLTILLVAVAGYILGMGVTITATYILLSVLAVPALMKMGVPLIAAHLVVFWFCETGGVTPPVALVAFAASSIARCNPYRAGLAAVRLASPLFILPFLFVYTPILLDGPLLKILETVISSMIGMIVYASMMQGYWLRHSRVHERILMGIAALCLFTPHFYTDFVGLGLLALVSYLQRKTA